MVQSQHLGKVLELKFVEQAAEDYPELQPVHISEDDILNLKHGTDVLLKIGEQVLAVGLTMRDDLSKLIKDVEKQLLIKGVTLEVTETAKDWLGEKGYDHVFGARPLRRVIQDEIEDRLSDALLQDRFSEGDRVLIDVQDGEVTLKSAPAPTEEPALA